MKTQNWTVDDLERLPDDDGKRYEIIDGELYVSTQPNWEHQFACSRLNFFLQVWNNQTNAGVVNFEPGIILSKENAVVPDIVWISNERLTNALHPDGKLHATPEIVVEVLSPGSENTRRDRKMKLDLYSRHNALEYWIINWQGRIIEVYRRKNDVLSLDQILDETDVLETPLLPGFQCHVDDLFMKLPEA
jgi:Uma2 family endonuclease